MSRAALSTDRATHRASDSATPDGTRERIMDAAELLFIEHGFAATSLRSIAQAAQVNLAATHYHFGSKQGLFAAVFHRRIGPADEARRAALDALLERPTQPGVRDIVTAFLSPFYADTGPLLQIAPRLVSRVFGEPDAVSKPLLEEEFNLTVQRFQQALASALPDVPAPEMRWRVHFMIGSMIQLLRYPAPLGMSEPGETFPASLDRLRDFIVAGIEQQGVATAGSAS